MLHNRHERRTSERSQEAPEIRGPNVGYTLKDVAGSRDWRVALKQDMDQDTRLGRHSAAETSLPGRKHCRFSSANSYSSRFITGHLIT